MLTSVDFQITPERRLPPDFWRRSELLKCEFLPLLAYPLVLRPRRVDHVLCRIAYMAGMQATMMKRLDSIRHQ